jgi:hypothetical protein
MYKVIQLPPRVNAPDNRTPFGPVPWWRFYAIALAWPYSLDFPRCDLAMTVEMQRVPLFYSRTPMWMLGVRMRYAMTAAARCIAAGGAR